MAHNNNVMSAMMFNEEMVIMLFFTYIYIYVVMIISSNNTATQNTNKNNATHSPMDSWQHHCICECRYVTIRINDGSKT